MPTLALYTPLWPPLTHLPWETLVLCQEHPLDDASPVLEAVAQALRVGGEHAGRWN